MQTHNAQATCDHAPTMALCVVALDGRVDVRARHQDDFPEPLERSPHRFKYRVGDRVIFVFALGAVVVTGPEALDAEVRAFIERISGRQLLDTTKEVYGLECTPASSPRVDWDRILVPRLDDRLVDVAALLLARSAGLERYERAAAPLVEEGLRLARDFAQGGRTPGRAGELVRRMARLGVARLELAHWFVHLDRPDAAWDDPTADRLYEVMADHLELAERHELLMHRIGSLEHSLTTIVRVWEGRRSRHLEWAIIWLIVVEIVLAVMHG
jgi:uncharacterized Rmd1/YagE family protein